MMARHKRMLVVTAIVLGVGIAAALAMQAFRKNVMFYHDPTEIADGKVPVDQRFRLGGMVVKGSIEKTPGSLDVKFLVTDYKHTVPTKCSPNTMRNTCRPRWHVLSRIIHLRQLQQAPR
jgi:cytochrome c-type biogenesis protein CcmE